MNQIYNYKKELKNNINTLIEENKLIEAKEILNQFEKIVSDDIEVYSFYGIINMMEGKIDEAENVLLQGLSHDNKNFDTLYNLGYLYEIKQKYNDSLYYYKKALKISNDKKINNEIKIKIQNLCKENNINEKVLEERFTKNKIVFFSKGDDKFIEDIIKRLYGEYDIKKITIQKNEDIKLIDKWMKWADICWFEWCDELVIYGSRLEVAKDKRVICRLHSYESFTNYPEKVNWNNVDKIIFVAEHIKNFVVNTFGLDDSKAIVMPNGVNIENFILKERTQGFKVAYVGYINYKKGPMLLLHTFKKIYDKDNRYTFYIAGEFQDNRDFLYFNQMIKEFGLENNIYFEGWQDDLNAWLEDKNYILCTSILESQNMSVMQAMAKGIKPIIHNFVGAKQIYSKQYIWNTIDEAVEMIESNNYNSNDYREFIEKNYSFDNQINEIRVLIQTLSKIDKKNIFNYKEYWNKRLNNKFNIEGVGYLGLGQIYNEFLYKNRFDILDCVFDKVLCELKDKKVLELGPGIGMFTEYFNSKNVKEYSAIDISSKSIQELSHKYKSYKFICGDISDNNNYNGKYDLIFAADVLLHITDENHYRKTINNISRYLNNDGICIMLDPITNINNKSESPHVVIRDKEYVKDILLENDLKLVEILPIAYFMNYPFDRKLLGKNEQIVLTLFNLITDIFSTNKFNKNEKKLVAKYLLENERDLLYRKEKGLSEKLLVIQKSNKKTNFNLNIQEILEMKNTKKNNLIHKNQFSTSNNFAVFKKIEKLIDILYKDELNIEYVYNKIQQFTSYDKNYIDEYNFNGAKIIIGKKEKINKKHIVIEFILNNFENKQLIINNIWYNIENKKFIFPSQIQNSKNLECIVEFLRIILDYDGSFKNNISGFILEEKIIEDIEQNRLAYIWERGIPASEFMPLMGYLRIAERYIFASKFIETENKVLEAPCGFGYGAAYFSKICKEVTAIDIASDNIEFAKKTYNHNNIKWNQENVINLPYKNDSFNVYTSYEVFEHLEVNQIKKYLFEAYRVISKGGKFIISTPNIKKRRNISNPFHIKEYTAHEFREILSQVFKDIEFYSMIDYKIERGIHKNAFNMIAVCQK